MEVTMIIFEFWLLSYAHYGDNSHKIAVDQIRDVDEAIVANLTWNSCKDLHV